MLLTPLTINQLNQFFPMANLPTKKLSFKETFRGFHLKVEFDCIPVSNDPRNIHDYNIMSPTITTCHEDVDVQLLVNSYERITFDIEQKILSKAHNLYMDSLQIDQIENRIQRNNIVHQTQLG